MKHLMLVCTALLACFRGFGDPAAPTIDTQVRTNGTVIAPWGSVPTSGSSTFGLSEAINSLPVYNNFTPNGGSVKLGTGIYYVTNTIVYSNAYNKGISIEGSGPQSTFLVYAGTKVQPLLRVDGVDGSMQNFVSIHNCGFASITNMQTNMIELKNVAKADIQFNWFAGQWGAATNNSAVVVAPNLKGLTTGWIQSSAPFNTNALVGIYFDGPFTDKIKIENNSFSYMACGLDLHSVDHGTVRDNFFTRIGVNNNWPNTSPYCMGPAIRCPHLTNDISWNFNIEIEDNYFYGCYSSIMEDGGADTSLSHPNVFSRGDNIICINNSYEGTTYGFLLDGNHRAVEINHNGGNLIAGNEIISVYPYSLLSTSTTVAFNPNLRLDRIRSFNVLSNYGTFTLSGSIALNNNLVVTQANLAFSNLAAVWVNSAQLSSANGVYSNVPTGFGSGCICLSNATTHYFLLIDPNSNKNGQAGIELWTNAVSEYYFWTSFLDSNPVDTGQTFDPFCWGIGQPLVEAMGPNYHPPIVVPIYSNQTATLTFPSGVVGVNDASSASAGSIGEIVTSTVTSGSATSLSTGTAKNVTSLSLTAGDWDVSGNVNFSANSATVTGTSGGITTTSATVPTDGTEVFSGVQVTLLSETDSVTLPRKRISISSTTTVYLVGKCTFSAGTVSAFGSITARRVR